MSYSDFQDFIDHLCRASDTLEGREDIDKWESEEYVEISEDGETDPEMYQEVHAVKVSPAHACS